MSTPARDAEGTARRRVFLFVNGILTRPGSADGWTDRAVTWTHLHTGARGEKFEYATTFATRFLRQRERAEKFARMVGWYSGARGNSPFQWEINLVGHSNGCDVILRTLGILLPSPVKINAVHLIAAACEADSEINGIKTFLQLGFVGRVCVYVGGKDRALRVAKLTEPWLRPFGLGYGSLGLTGPAYSGFGLTPPVETIVEPGFGHSTWFEKGQFDRTMGMVTGGNIQAPSTKHQIISKHQGPSTGEVPRSNLQNEVNRAERVSAQAVASRPAGAVSLASRTLHRKARA